jgi:hypothetical protein
MTAGEAGLKPFSWGILAGQGPLFGEGVSSR